MMKIRKPDEALLKFFQNEERVQVAQEVYELFPGLVGRLSKVQFWRQLFDSLSQMLAKDTRLKKRWRMEQIEDSDDELFETPWTEMYAVPCNLKSPKSYYWYFGINMDARKLPFSLFHGICAPGDVTSLPTAVKAANAQLVKALEDEGLRIENKNDWVTVDYSIYEDISFGDNADVLKRIVSAKLAGQVAEEFVRFIKEWADVVEEKNAAVEKIKRS